jgi:hypothetical protein
LTSLRRVTASSLALGFLQNWSTRTASPREEADGPATVLDFVPPKRISRTSRLAQTLALGLLLVTVPHVDARADQATVVAPLPMCVW